jgi:hypothetical protein
MGGELPDMDYTNISLISSSVLIVAEAIDSTVEELPTPTISLYNNYIFNNKLC